MKKIYILIIVAVLAVGGVAGVVLTVGNVAGPKYDQSSPEATAKSFIQAMLNGDTEAFGLLTRDVIPWSYMVSDLISYSTKDMTGWTIKDYSYYQQGISIVVYNHSLNPSPDSGTIYSAGDFFAMEFAMANGKFYITDLSLPGYVWASWDTDWKALCDEALANGCTKFK